MKHIVVYTTRDCPWCVRAKTLLKSKGLDYEEINISSDPDFALEMLQRSGRRTVPQIFIDNKSIGGFTELAGLSKERKLD